MPELDAAWLQRVQVHLTPLVREGRLELWDDTRIKAGQRWREEIKDALVRTKVGVLLISADFYGSDFIARNELPPLLEAERERGLVIIGLHINYSRFDRDRVLSEYQTVNTPSRPVEDLPRAQQEKVFDDLARRIEELLEPQNPLYRNTLRMPLEQTVVAETSKPAIMTGETEGEAANVSHEMNPLAVLREARKAVPAVDYALGLAGIEAATSIVVYFTGRSSSAVVIMGLAFLGMILLFISPEWSAPHLSRARDVAGRLGIC